MSNVKGFEPSVTPFLWFDGQAEEAAKFYVSIFKKAKIKSTTRFPDVGQEVHGRAPGSVMTVNPFDEPNVTEAKLATSALLAIHEKGAHLWVAGERGLAILYVALGVILLVFVAPFIYDPLVKGPMKEPSTPPSEMRRLMGEAD